MALSFNHERNGTSSFQGRAYGEYADAVVDERMVRRHERGSLVPIVEPLSSGDSAEHKQGTVLG